MPDQLRKYTDPIKARWDVLTPPQRYKLLGVIAVVLIAVILTAFIAFRPRWVVIVNNQDVTAINPMRRALDQAGIRHQTINHDSGLRVDERRVNEAVDIIQMEGAAPNSEHFTWAHVWETGLGTTDDERRSREIRGLEGAIERQLTNINTIQNADAGVTVPNARPFDRNAPLPSAAVTITVTPDFSPATGRSLATIVAQNVGRLEIDNIIIVDQFGRTIWDGMQDIQNDPVGIAQQRQEQYHNQAVVATQRIFGMSFEDVRVAFSPTFDETLLTEEIREIFEIPEGMDGGGIPHLAIESRGSLEGTPGGIEPGLAPNAPFIPGYMMPGGGTMTAEQRENHTEFLVNTTRTVTQTGGGWLVGDQSYAAITVGNPRHVYQDLWMTQGENDEERTQQDWEIYKAANANPIVINSSFEQYEYFLLLAARALGIPPENVQLIVTEWLVPHDTIPRPWDIPTILMVAVLLLLLAMLLFGLLRRQKQADEDEESLEPQLAVEDLLVSTQLEEAKEEEAAQLEEIDYFKENEIKKHIDKFVNEKPEAVAALLRNWINVEEW
jgi:flagellar M-ring protein FliF